MEDVFDNTLNINFSDGSKATINVLDIIDSYAFNKSFIVYTFKEAANKIFASILNLSDTSYSLAAIENEDELKYVNSEIERYVNESEDDL